MREKIKEKSMKCLKSIYEEKDADIVYEYLSEQHMKKSNARQPTFMSLFSTQFRRQTLAGV